MSILEKAFETIIHRHEILRTRLVTIDTTPRQVIEAPQPFILTVSDWQDKSEAEIKSYIQANHVNYVFDLSQDSLIKIQLLQTTAERYLLLVNIHHIISDGSSIGILLKELTTLYNAYINGQSNPLKPLRIQYKDYSAWQEILLNEESYIGELRQFWHQQLAGFQPVELLTDFPRPTIQQYEGDNCVYKFDNKA